ncbi:MAG TPA: cytochrome d ubiquinol oxidase subunit II [Solirubrobacteraceae bacterium]|nr:cytochrome d ubiquinol oxidase subunit II [Solirubrobacteraceae bacterium]
MLPELSLGLVILGITAYAVMGSADFGAGFWDLTAGGAERGGRVRGMVQRSMSPVWEANHVWLIFVLVIFWTAYPVAFGSVMSTLSLPLFAAAIGVILRGMAYAMRSGAQPGREMRRVDLLFSLSSILTPFALGVTVGAIASGRVPVGNAEGGLIDSWLHATPLFAGALGVATSAYLAAVFLAGDAVRHGDADMAEAFRRRALGAGVVAGALALAGLPIVHGDARELWDGLTSGAALAAVIGSGAAGAITLALLVRRRYEPARYAAASAVAAVVLGWCLAQEPFLLPGLSVHEAAADRATLVAVVLGVVGGMAILLPCLALLFRLVLGGRFDAPARPPETRSQPSPAPRLWIPAAMAAAGAPLALFGPPAGEYVGFALLMGAIATGAVALLGPALGEDG